MRLTGSRAYYRQAPPKMPAGMVELMEDLTREVLKNNPDDIYGFCAGHVQHLLEIRDGPLQKKILTLDKKIAKAQEKVRQRSEKRRQLYDTELLFSQQYETSLNKDNKPSFPSQVLIKAENLRTPIHQEKELVNSSELEVSYAPDVGIQTPSEDSQFEKNNVPAKDVDDATKNYTNTIMHMEHASNKETNKKSADLSNINFISQDVAPLHNLVTKETKQLEDNKNANISSETVEGQSTYSEENLLNQNHLVISGVSDFQESNEVNIDDHIDDNLSNPVSSLTVNAVQKLIIDSAEILQILTEGDAENSTSVKSDKQNSPAQTAVVTTINDVKETVHQSNNIDETLELHGTLETKQSNNENIKESNDIESVVQQINNEIIINANFEDTKESDAIEICFKESPGVELQDSLQISDMLESLPATETDSDISTLITQDYTDDKLLQHIELNKCNSNSMESVPNAEGDKEHDESNINKSDEELHNTTHHQNKTIDISFDNNDNDSENHTQTKLINGPQINNQDNSNMNLETAAITIQKVFRNFLFKSRNSTFDDTVNDETNFSDEYDKNKEECDFPKAGALNNERRSHGLTRMDTVLQTVNEEKSLSLSTDDSSTLSSAATVIQAHIRGFLVRNKLNSNKTISTNSLAGSNSNGPSLTSLEMDNDQSKNKTKLNIHIVPEGGNYLSRDESVLTSMDLSLDSSPPSSVNLHPLGYDKSERRKQLKREDAIQSISPPSNNSGKLSEDVDSVKEIPLNDKVLAEHQELNYSINNDSHESISAEIGKMDQVENIALKVVENLDELPANTKDNDSKIDAEQKRRSLTKTNSDEMDVVTPFSNEDTNSSSDTKLMHSGEFHDAVLPTKVSRSDTSIASEFKNVLVYFLLWNNS